jgi:hypothetical protein
MEISCCSAKELTRLDTVGVVPQDKLMTVREIYVYVEMKYRKIL